MSEHVESFADTWADVESIAGWLTEDQAKVLWDEVRRLPPSSRVVEIGSHKGRSTCVLARAMQRSDGSLVAIDPFVEGRLFGGTPTRTVFETNIAALGVQDVVELVPRRSTELRPTWTDPIDLLYIDGKHDYWTVSDDLLWSKVCRPGAAVLIHDSFSSIGVTTSLIRHVLVGGALRYDHRVGSLAVFRVDPVTAADRWGFVRELPWWARNVLVKVALRARFRLMARALGHEGAYDPY